MERECDCPEWVLRCAHWKGQLLHLADLKKHTELCTEAAITHEHTWSVSHGPPDDTPGHVRGGFYNRLRTNDLSAAIAEFEQRELQLLGREIQVV